MCMARVNVYLPDDLADEARQAGLNVSNVVQTALRNELRVRRTTDWVTRVLALPATAIEHDEVVAAIRAARDELGVDG